MKYRQIRIRATGQWINVLFTVAGDGDHPDTFVTPAEAHLTDIARNLNMPPSELEAVDADSDVRTGPMLPLNPKPAPPLSPSEQRQARIKELLALGDANLTLAHLRELTLLAARELT